MEKTSEENSGVSYRQVNGNKLVKKEWMIFVSRVLTVLNIGVRYPVVDVLVAHLGSSPSPCPRILFHYE